MTASTTRARTPLEIGGAPPGRVAVLRALKLGDLLVAVPALRALRAALPGASVALIGLPWAREFARRFSCYLDEFIEFPGWTGLPERPADPSRAAAFLEGMRRWRPDLAVQLHGSGERTNGVVARLGSRALAGFYRPGRPCPDPDRFLPWPESGREARRLLGLATFLGAPDRGDHLEFPLSADDREALASALGPRRLGPGSYAVVHPGASVPGRRWPPERFACVADALARRGLEVVLSGTAAEAGLTGAVGRAMRSPALDLAGRTGLGALGALVEGARLVVCNDTGIAHVADALRVPSVIRSTADNPSRWAPADALLHRVLCRDDGGGVTAAEVVSQAESLLNDAAARAG